MKNKMNIKFVFGALTVLLLSMVGCSSTSESSDNGAKESTESVSEALNRHLIKLDSLSEELGQKVAALTSELKEAKSEIESLKNRDEKKNKILSLLSIAIGAVALVGVICLCFRKKGGLKKGEVEDIINNCLRKQGFLEARDYVQLMMNSRNQYKSANVDFYGSRVVKLEQELERLKNEKRQMQQRKLEGSQTMSPVATKYLYAKINSDEYFVNVTESKQDTCVFLIELKSQTRGEFDIISLDKIKQRNGWEKIIKYTGDCGISDAKSYKTIQRGRCEKMSDGTWKVVDKLEISINK